MRMLRIIAIAILPSLAACFPTGPGAQKDFTYGYMDRYPLAGPSAVRIDVSAHRPTADDELRVQQVAAQFLRTGQGKIVIFVPQSGPAALSSGNWVKQQLMASGVSSSRIQWDARPLPAGVVRLAFAGGNQKTVWNCTNLNEDVQQRADETSYLNRELVNFGCAYQSNMRAQADNPNDFIHPRAETGIDPVRAANAVRQLRTKTSSSAVGTGSP